MTIRDDHGGPIPKCHHCGANRWRKRRKPRKPANKFWACPERKFSDKSTSNHSAVSSDKIVMVGQDGNWEEKK